MINTKQLEKHLSLAKRIVKDTQVLAGYYRNLTPRQVAELLSVAIECDILPEAMSIDCCLGISLKQSRSYFKF